MSRIQAAHDHLANAIAQLDLADEEFRLAGHSNHDAAEFAREAARSSRKAIKVTRALEPPAAYSDRGNT